MSARKPPMIRLGISSCLLGQRVRYDGKHKRDAYIAGILARDFEFVPVCPEVAIGLGVPRAPIELVGVASAPRALGVEDAALDVTRPLAAHGRRMARALPDISGYIFKSRSPSCGIAKVPVRGSGQRTGASGIYAAAFMAARPLLPVEDEDRLKDAQVRENFIQRVLVYHRWQQLAAQGVSAARLVDFHAAHKLVIMAHGISHYRRLDQLVATLATRPIHKLARVYIQQLMRILAEPATVKRHSQVLMHLMRYLKKSLDAEDQAELLQQIHAYRLGHVPLVLPLTLLRRHFQCHPHDDVIRQVYLYPPAHEPKRRAPLAEV